MGVGGGYAKGHPCLVARLQERFFFSHQNFPFNLFLMGFEHRNIQDVKTIFLEGYYNVL